jgi:hypothetical protein
MPGCGGVSEVEQPVSPGSSALHATAGKPRADLQKLAARRMGRRRMRRAAQWCGHVVSVCLFFYAMACRAALGTHCHDSVAILPKRPKIFLCRMGFKRTTDRLGPCRFVVMRVSCDASVAGKPRK